MKIIWSERAFSTYDETIDYLIENWPINIAEGFEERTNQLLDHLKQNSLIGISSKQNKLRKCIIHPNVSLIYKVLDTSTIELVTFVQNRTDHNY